MTSGKFSGGVGPLSDKVGPNLEALRERFWNYTPVDRDHERRGILYWDSDPDLNCGAELHIEEHPDRAFMLVWVLKIPIGMKPTSYWSVSDPKRLTEDDWFNIADDGWALEGNFVPLEIAWAAIEDFFADPLKLSTRVQWIESEQMPPHPIQ